MSWFSLQFLTSGTSHSHRQPHPRPGQDRLWPPTSEFCWTVITAVVWGSHSVWRHPSRRTDTLAVESPVELCLGAQPTPDLGLVVFGSKACPFSGLCCFGPIYPAKRERVSDPGVPYRDLVRDVRESYFFRETDGQSENCWERFGNCVSRSLAIKEACWMLAGLGCLITNYRFIERMSYWEGKRARGSTSEDMW